MAAVPRAWYAGRVAVREPVDCGGATHHVTWRRGRLVLEDHDVAAERALRGLGADKAACIEILDTWRELNSRPALEELSRLLHTTGRPAGDDRLPGALGRVAALATVVRCQRRWSHPDFTGDARRIVGNALTARLGEAIKASLGDARRSTARRLRVRSRCEMLGPGETASLSIEVHVGRAEITMAAGIPISWLVDVWGRDIAAIDGHVVIEADGVDAGRIAVAAIDWSTSSRGEVEPRLVSGWAVRESGRWRIDRDAVPPRLARRPWCSVEAAAPRR